MRFGKRHRQDPLIFRLIFLFFGDRDQGESVTAPMRDRTVLLLMLLAGIGALLFGLASGLVPGIRM
jgi:hypothetical protein